ncbi:MAG: type III pantothenate kinase [Clostridia bacterium]|nr:type III pantothenate kinase [Clostridia bacterium]
MIICIDIGNTNVKYAIFDGETLKFSFRVATDLKRTSDEYGAQLVSMLEFNGISVKDVTGGIFSSVVPSLDYTVDHMLRLYLGIAPKQIAPGLKTGLSMRADNAREVGADRIVNNVSAIKKYGCGKPMIVVDFGTATTFNIINDKYEFIGGVIAPGIRGSLDSLVSGTAKLPRVEIEAPRSVIATNTVTNMQAGIVFGFAGLVEFIVKKIRTELGVKEVLTIATGGFSEIIAKETKCIDVIDKMLTLNGLKYLYDLNDAEETK